MAQVTVRDGDQGAAGAAPEEGSARKERARQVAGEMAGNLRNLPVLARRADDALVRMMHERPIVTLGVVLVTGYVVGRALRRFF